MFGQDRNQLRTYYRQAWQKALASQPLDGLEQQIVAVIHAHPEYHQLILDPSAMARDWSPDLGETNPFLHLGMHLALREQVSTNRPKGIADCFEKLCLRTQDVMEAEHLMMDCLAEAIWQAQRYQHVPDEQSYLHCLQQLIT